MSMVSYETMNVLYREYTTVDAGLGGQKPRLGASANQLTAT